MLVCNCTLPYTNPDACKNCSRYLESTGGFNPFELPYDPGKDQTVPCGPPWDPNLFPKPQTRDIKKTKRTIEKFDENGKLIGREVITEELEIYQEYAYYTTSYTYNNAEDEDEK